jgi:ATP-dependent protease ClpP protease subunit
MPISVTLNTICPSIRLTGEIDMALALSLLDELSLLYSYYQFRTIELQINSPGGDAAALHFLVEELAPWRRSEGRVLKTVAISEVASAAALLLSFGSAGHRSAFKQSRMLYHPARTIYPAGVVQTGAQLRTVTRKLESWNKYFVDLMAEHISEEGSEREAYKRKLKKLFNQERFIGPEEACKMKLIDRVR